MKIISGSTKLFDLEQSIWHYTNAQFDFMNNINGIKLVEQTLYIQYLGGEFNEPYTFWFKLNKETFDALWAVEFGETYDQTLDFENKNLNWFCDISLIVFNLLTTNRFQENHYGRA
ncbi:hypothetical protein [Bacillus cereus]|uniref:hypothetical protein n=1 Tax=Bacillus cereus TaxID=1396 RepID=UPI000B4C16F4|nr:hypothetical protein [Bacillus cereus]